MSSNFVPGRRAKTFAYFGAFVGLGLVLASLGPTIPDLAAHTRSTLSAFSAVFIAHAGGYLTGAMLGGRLFDRFAGHPMMAMMLLVIAACMTLVPLCPSLVLLIVVFAVMGISEGALDAGGNTLLMWLYPTGLGPWMNGLHFFFGAGALLSPLIIAAIVDQSGSVVYAYWTLAALLLPLILWLLSLPSPRISKPQQDGGIDLRPYRGTIVLTAALLFAAVGAEVGFGNWLYTYTLQQGLADEAGSRLMTSVFWGAFTVGRLLAIPLAARMTPVTLLAMCLVACGAAAVLPLLWPTLTGMLWAATILGGVAVAPLFATALSLAGGRMPISGRATGWFFVGSSTGGMIVPWAIGQVFEPLSPLWMFWIILIDVAFGLVICAVLWQRGQRAEL